MSIAFTRKLIRLTVQLATNSGTNQPNTFVGTGSDTTVIGGTGNFLRTSVRIQDVGSVVAARAQVKVWGLPPTLMNELSTLGLSFNLIPQNELTVEAGDENGNFSRVFAGTIQQAYGDYSAQPDVPFHFECLGGGYARTKTVPPSSFRTSTSVADVMSGFARQLNIGFENNGVTARLPPSYLTGSVWDQADQAARWANIKWTKDDAKGVLAIWPKGGARAAQTIPIISKATGMITSPAFTQAGIVVSTLFQPQLAYGSPVKVESVVLQGVTTAQLAKNPALVLPKNSEWAINKLDLALDALLPKGQWMAVVSAYNPNYARPLVTPQ